jgi:N-acetylglucosaminyldiphosphoundecaprenol N-acetyl-beta-D-mannosaminyltransferase
MYRTETAAKNRPTILGIPFDPVTMEEAINRVAAAISKHIFCQIVTPGPEFIMRAQHDVAFAEVIRSAELSLPDGMGVVFAAKALGLPPLTRVTGNDLMDGIFDEAVKKNWRVYLYGTLREGAIARAAAAAVKKYPGLHIVGADSGFRRWLRVPDTVACWRIRRSKADVLFVALGAPAQDLWIARNRHRLGNVMVAAGIGGAIDYLSGALPRAPKLFQMLGLEWLVRLIMQPRRRWRRIVTAVIKFPAAVVREKIRGGSHA